MGTSDDPSGQEPASSDPTQSEFGAGAMTPISIEAPADAIERWVQARERKAQASRGKLQLYYSDPVAFIHDCVDFPHEGGLTPYQEEIISQIPVKGRVSVRAPHGTGKSLIAAVLTHWFALTRDAAGIDWKMPITAGAWRQLEKYLWPEIHKVAKYLRWDRIGRDPYRRTELISLNLKLNHGSAFAVASNVPAYIEGAHADSIFYLFDEAKAIVDATYDAAEGAFSGSGHGGTEAFALASSTPGEPVGRFYDLQTHKKGFEDWWVRHITLEEAMSAGRINTEWVEQRKLQWGVDSQLYANRVLGEFHANDQDAMIPLSWVEAAIERWYEHESEALGEMERLGADIAGMGKDKTVLARVHGFRVQELLYSFHEDTVKTKDRIVKIMEQNNQVIATIDADGLGVGVYDNVKATCGADRVRAFHASAATDWRDASGELQFINVRSASWHSLRQMLDPARGATLELPPDDQLIADLCAPKMKQSARGKIQLESKDDVKKRLGGRSTDSADAIVMALWNQRRRRRRRMGSMGLATGETSTEL